MAVFAKGIDRASNYDYRQWEFMEGTEDLTEQEAQEFIEQCVRDDKATYGYVTTTYKYTNLSILELIDQGFMDIDQDTTY